MDEAQNWQKVKKNLENIPVSEYNNMIGFSVPMEASMNFLTTVEAAEKWNISRRRVATFCRDGRIDGAVLKGKTWLIPEDAEKPQDPRKKRQRNKA